MRQAKGSSKSFLNILGKLVEIAYRANIIFIVTHRNADPDALASSIILWKFFHKVLHRFSLIVLPEGLNEVAKKIAYKLSLNNIVHRPDIITKTGLTRGTNVLFVVVDTGSSTQLGLLRDIILCSRYIVIDHHRSGDLVEGALLSIVESEFTSSTELVYHLLGGMLEFTREDRVLMLTGILYDTRRFIHISPITLEVASKIIDECMDTYLEALRLLQTEMDISERIARLKAVQRMGLERIDDIVIAYTHVSAYESSVARALLDLGADVAVVLSAKKKEIRLVARAKQRFYEETGISLGRDIMPLVGGLLGGSGGGHDTAAAASGSSGEPDKVLSYTIDLIARMVREKFRVR